MSDTHSGYSMSATVLSNEHTAQASTPMSRAHAVTEMVRLYRPRLLRVAYRILQHAEDAEDAVQNTFICALTHLEQFRGECLLSTWLTRIAINQALVQLRRTRHRHVESLDEDSSANNALKEMLDSKAPNPEELFLQAELRQHLRSAVAELPEGLRTVRHKSLFSGEPVTEIARNQQISKAAAKSRLLRARQALKAELVPRFRVFPRDSAAVNGRTSLRPVS